MRKAPTIIATAALALSVSLGAYARLTASQALLSAPAELILPVPSSAVEQMLSLADAGVESPAVPNLMNSESKLERLDSVHARLATGGGRVLDFYVLPSAKGDTAIAVIETLTTVGGPDSRMSVYSRDWQPLNKAWNEPRAQQWLTPAGRKARIEFERNVPFMLGRYDFDPATMTLTITNGTDSVLDPDRRKGAAGLMLPTLRYRWNGKAFKALK